MTTTAATTETARTTDGATTPAATGERVAPGERRRRGSRMLALAFLGAAALGSACSHTHLSPNYGVAYNAWFTSQYVRHEPADSDATRRALGSLDAQEAASISKNYRKNTSGQADGAGQGQMVMIGQTRGGTDSYTPPPSVPGGN
jgi:hypothetical protein